MTKADLKAYVSELLDTIDRHGVGSLTVDRLLALYQKTTLTVYDLAYLLEQSASVDAVIEYIAR